MAHHDSNRDNPPEREEDPPRSQYPAPPGSEERSTARSPQTRAPVSLPPIRDPSNPSNGYSHPMGHHGPPPPSGNGYNASPASVNGYPPPPGQNGPPSLPSIQPSSADPRSPGYPAHGPPPQDPRDPYYEQRRAYERDPYYGGAYRGQPLPPPEHGRGEYPRDYGREYGRPPPPPPPPPHRDDYYRSHPPPPRHEAEYGRPPPGYDEYGRPPPRGPYDADYVRDPRNGYVQYPPQGAHQMQQAAPRQRTSIACRYCRKRKIRCSGYQNAPGGRCVNCARMNQECVFQPVSSSSSATFVHVSAVTGGLAPGTQLYGAYGQPIGPDGPQPPGPPGPPGPPQSIPSHPGPPRTEHAPHHPPPGPPHAAHQGPPSGPPPPGYGNHPPAPPPNQTQQYPPQHPPSAYYPLPVRSPTDTYSSYPDSDATSSSGRRRRRESNEGHERRLPPPNGSEEEARRRTPISGSNSPDGAYYPSQAPMPTPRPGASQGNTPPTGSAIPTGSAGSGQAQAQAQAGPTPSQPSPVGSHVSQQRAPSQQPNGYPEPASPRGVGPASNGSTTPTKAGPAPAGGNRASSVMNLNSLIVGGPGDSAGNDIDRGMLGRLNRGSK